MTISAEIIIPFHRSRIWDSEWLNISCRVTKLEGGQDRIQSQAHSTMKFKLGSKPVPLAGLAHGTNEVRALGVGLTLSENENVLWPRWSFFFNCSWFCTEQISFLWLWPEPQLSRSEWTPLVQRWNKVRELTECRPSPPFHRKPLALAHHCQVLGGLPSVDRDPNSSFSNGQITFSAFWTVRLSPWCKIT